METFENYTNGAMLHSAKAFDHFQVASGPSVPLPEASSLSVGEEFCKMGGIYSRYQVHVEREMNDPR